MAQIDLVDEEWAALSGLLDEALELPHDDRARWIETCRRSTTRSDRGFGAFCSRRARSKSSTFLQDDSQGRRQGQRPTDSGEDPPPTAETIAPYR